MPESKPTLPVENNAVEEKGVPKPRCGVLLVEDDPVDRRQIQLLLAKSSRETPFEVETAATLRAAADHLRNNRYGVILLDLGLPDSSGLGTIQEIRSQSPDVPIVVLTGLDDEETGVEAIREGAQDYLVKGQSLEYVLIRTIRYAIERGQMRESLQRAYDAQKTINQALSSALENIDLEALFEQTIDGLTSIPWLELDRRGAVFLVEAEPTRLVLKAHRGLPASGVKACAQVPLGACVCGKATVSNEIEFGPCPRVHWGGEQEGERVCHLYCIPIHSGGTPLGALTLCTGRQHPYRAREEQLLRSVCDVLGTAIERKRAQEVQTNLLAELENANRELWDFVYQVSHEVKMPLRRVGTLAKYLLTDYADELDENGKTQINQLQSRVVKVNDLIDAILRRSRIERTREGPVPVDLKELVQEIIGMLAPPANMTITIDNRLPVVKCELTRIAPVLQNLLSNAIKYMDKPHGRIAVTCDDMGDFWRLGVTDNGPGIEETRLERIFQLPQTLAPSDDGASRGVSLPVARKAVQMYGGKMWVESEVGKGSTFLFTLPKQPREVSRADVETGVAYGR